MASRSIVRWIRIQFDRLSAKKAEGELAASMGSAGKKGGENFLREAKAAFERRLAELKNLLAKGLIDQKTFKAQADLAARTFNNSIIKGMESARAAGKLTDAEYLKLSRTLKTVGVDGATAGGKIGAAFKGAVAGFAAFFTFGKVRAFFADSFHEAIAATEAIGRLDVALRTVGLTYRGVSVEAERYITQLVRTTRFTDDDARLALGNLITGTGSYEKALRLLNVTAQIAEKRNITMADAADVAIKASRGLTKGMIDLGIGAKDTGDLIAKVEKNLGRLAEEGLDKPGRKIQQLNKLWDDFKEKIGLAILGSDTLSKSLGSDGLTGTLQGMNDWVEKNSGSIGRFVDGIFDAIRAMQAFGRFWLKYIPNPIGLKRHIDIIRGIKDFSDVVSGGTTTVKPKGAPGGGGGGGEPSDIAKARGAELERIEREIAVKRLVIEKGLTEELAREAVRRDELITPPLQHETASIAQLEAAWKRLASSNLIFAAGLDKELIPAVVKTESQVAQLAAVTQTFAEAQPALAGQFSSPWIDAMGLIRNEVEGQGTLFRELGEAWAEGGIAGLARLAAGKVKENLAQAIEMAAKALGLFAFGNPGAAAAAGKSAALHSAAAIAWKTVGNVAGALGGGAGSSSSGGVGSSAPNQARATSVEKQTPETHIHFKGSSFFIPEVQKQIYASQLEARQKYGQNAKIIVHRDN